MVRLIKKILFFLGLVLVGCNSNSSFNKEIELKEKRKIKIPIDSLSNFRTATFQSMNNLLFTDVRGMNRQNFINVYDLTKLKLKQKLQFPTSRQEGVGFISGFWAEDMDNIYILGGMSALISVVNTKNEITTKYNLGTNVLTGNGKPWGRTEFSPRRIDNNFFFEIGPYFDFQQTEGKVVEYKFNIETKESTPNFYYPEGVELSDFYIQKSRVFLEDNTEIFLFSSTNSLYILKDGETEKIDLSIPNWQKPNFQVIRENPSYHKEVEFYLENFSADFLLYDKYRQLLYCFIGVPTELVNPVDGRRNNYEDKRGVLYVLNIEDYSILGSLDLNPKVFFWRNFFVNEEGLWISNSSYLNPNLDENEFSFTLFNLLSK